jgi:hypothetical protein
MPWYVPQKVPQGSYYDTKVIVEEVTETLRERVRQLERDLTKIYDMLSCLGIRVNGLECAFRPPNPSERAADRNFITVRDKDYNFSHYVYKIKTEE